VSDNAVSYDSGEVLVVFPDTGAELAPNGLGGNVRGKARGLGLTESSGAQLRNVNGCPEGWTSNSSWYCFYDDAGFGGRRLQFKDTARGYMGNYGFENKTSSWVNTRGDWSFNTYASNSFAESSRMWFMGADSKSSYVGAKFNDKLKAWRNA
jgi:hypothetical protein